MVYGTMYLFALIRSFASHVTAFTLYATLRAVLGAARLLTVPINSTRLNTSHSSGAILGTSSLTVLIAVEG